MSNTTPQDEGVGVAEGAEEGSEELNRHLLGVEKEDKTDMPEETGREWGNTKEEGLEEEKAQGRRRSSRETEFCMKDNCGQFVEKKQGWGLLVGKKVCSSDFSDFGLLETSDATVIKRSEKSILSRV